MRLRTAVLGAASGAVLAGGLLLAPVAQADEADCNGLAYDLDVNVNGDAVVDESGCLSTDGGGAPGLPGAPELPPLEPPALPAP